MKTIIVSSASRDRSLARRLVCLMALAAAVAASLVSAQVLRAAAPPAQVRVNSNPLGGHTEQADPSISGDTIVWVDWRADTGGDIYMKNLSSGVETVAVANRGARAPDVAQTTLGAVVVWQDWRNGNSDIFMKNLTTGVETTVDADPSGQSNPAVSQTTAGHIVVVWEDDRNDTDPSTDYIDVYMRDMTSGETTAITTHPLNLHPDISGDIVVWEYARPAAGLGNPDIHGKNIVTGANLYPAATNEYFEEDPSISGNVVAYTEKAVGAAREIRTITIGSADAVKITDDLVDQENPVVSDEYVVWEESNGGQPDIRARLLSGGPIIAVTANSAAEGHPEVYGGKVVWADSRAGDGNVYLKNLDDGSETCVTADDRVPSNQYGPSIDGERVVWEDNRDDPDWLRIRTKDMSSGVESQVSAGTFDMFPDVSGDFAVWTDEAVWPTAIGALRLSTGVPVDLGTPSESQGYATVSGNTMVWEDSRNDASSGTDVYSKNLLTGAESAICMETGYQGEADISGNTVVWTDSRDATHTGSDIYVKDLSTNLESAVTTAAGNQSDPSVSGHFVVWEDFRSDPAGDIYARDLWTGQESIVSASAGAQEDPAISNGVCVWIDESPGYPTLRARRLPSGTEDVIVDDPRAKPAEPQISGSRIVWTDYREGTEELPDANIYTTDYEDADTGPLFVPIEGPDRYGTAVAASHEAFLGGAPVVVVATGVNWPDALGGAALASAEGGPILLTRPDALPAEVAAEIVRLKATDAIVLGSSAAVSGDVESALEAMLGDTHVRRIGGSDRYATARLIAQETVAKLGASYDGTCFIATGSNFPDALGASPLAAAKRWPLLLVSPSAGLPASTKATMDGLGVTRAVILGGAPAVPSSVETALAAYAPIRLAGATRYGTAAAVAAYGVGDCGLGWDKVAIATGQNFPDALAGGVLQGKDESVMLLTPSKSLDASAATALEANGASIHTVRYLGSVAALSAEVRGQVEGLLR